MEFLTSEFTIFSLAHLLSVVMGFSIAYSISRVFRKNIKYYSYAIFGLSLIWWLNREFSPILDHQGTLDNLPLQLCDITLLICAYVLYTKNDKLFPFLVFTAIGALLAIVTPTVTGTRGILTLTNILFYTTHCSNFMVIGVLYKNYDMRIAKNDWIKSFSILSHLALFMIIINPILDTNFFYVTKPINNPIVNALGEEYVLVGFFVLALLLFFFLERIVIKLQSDINE